MPRSFILTIEVAVFLPAIGAEFKGSGFTSFQEARPRISTVWACGIKGLGLAFSSGKAFSKFGMLAVSL